MINYEMTMPNGAIGRYHKAVKFEIHEDATHAVVNSYHSDEMDIISWQDTYVIPIVFKIETLADVEMILAMPEAPFGGGTIIPNETATLEAAQARKWGEVKIVRQTKLNGVCPTPHGPIQCDETSLSRLQGATALITADRPTVSWTMADNSKTDATETMINEMLFAARTYINQVHFVSQALRMLIYEGGISIEDVEAIAVANAQWPASASDTVGSEAAE
jgi:hypothetical protein